MDHQGAAIKWILILGIGTFLFLGGTAAVMRRAGLGGTPLAVRKDASPYSGEAVVNVYRRFCRTEHRLLLTEVFNVLRENGFRPRLVGTLDQPEAVWALTEGRADAPLLPVVVSVSGGNGPAAAAWLVELARVIPPKGMRHRVAMVWVHAADDSGGFSEFLERLPGAAAWKGRIACRVVLSFCDGSAVWIARDSRTPEPAWETVADASRRAGYIGLLRPLPADTPKSAVQRSGSVPEARFNIGLPGGPGSPAVRDGLKISGDVFYHTLATLGYEMIVRLGTS